MYLERAHPLLADQHEVGDPKPELQVLLSVLENRSRDDAEPIIFTVLTKPMIRLRLERKYLVARLALGADDAVRPARIPQIIAAGIFSREAFIEGV